jgi:hypothetical protein
MSQPLHLPPGEVIPRGCPRLSSLHHLQGFFPILFPGSRLQYQRHKHLLQVASAVALWPLPRAIDGGSHHDQSCCSLQSEVDHAMSELRLQVRCCSAATGRERRARGTRDRTCCDCVQFRSRRCQWRSDEARRNEFPSIRLQLVSSQRSSVFIARAHLLAQWCHPMWSLHC